jgi:hypothetical protein
MSREKGLSESLPLECGLKPQPEGQRVTSVPARIGDELQVGLEACGQKNWHTTKTVDRSALRK